MSGRDAKIPRRRRGVAATRIFCLDESWRRLASKCPSASPRPVTPRFYLKGDDRHDHKAFDVDKADSGQIKAAWEAEKKRADRSLGAGRGDAAAATWRVSGDGTRRRRGHDAATGRGDAVAATGRGDAAATTWRTPR